MSHSNCIPKLELKSRWCLHKPVLVTAKLEGANVPFLTSSDLTAVWLFFLLRIPSGNLLLEMKSTMYIIKSVEGIDVFTCMTQRVYYGVSCSNELNYTGKEIKKKYKILIKKLLECKCSLASGVSA